MNRFSKTQIYLHWLTLLFVAITYAAMELRGWFPKGSSTYLLMRETHYNAGIFVWVLMFSRLIIKHRYSDPSIVPPPPAWQMKAASLMHIMLYITFLALPGNDSNLLIVFYVQIMPDDFVMQLHRF